MHIYIYIYIFIRIWHLTVPVESRKAQLEAMQSSKQRELYEDMLVGQWLFLVIHILSKTPAAGHRRTPKQSPKQSAGTA